MKLGLLIQWLYSICCGVLETIAMKTLATLAWNELWPSGLSNWLVCKRFAVQTFLWSLEFVIQIILEHDTIACLYQIETSPLICSANQWTGFYTTATYVMKELITSGLIYFRKIWIQILEIIIYNIHFF